MYISFAIRVNPLLPSISLVMDRSRRWMRDVAARMQEPRSRCPAAILIHKSQGAPWSYSNTSERQTPHLIEPRRVLTRGGSVLKPLSSVKDHRKPVRLPSRPLGQLRARSRYPSSSCKPVCPRHCRRYIHLCFSLCTIASSRLFLSLSQPRTPRRDHYDLVAGLMSRHNRRGTKHATSSRDRRGGTDSRRLDGYLDRNFRLHLFFFFFFLSEVCCKK